MVHLALVKVVNYLCLDHVAMPAPDSLRAMSLLIDA